MEKRDEKKTVTLRIHDMTVGTRIVKEPAGEEVSHGKVDK